MTDYSVSSCSLRWRYLSAPCAHISAMLFLFLLFSKPGYNPQNTLDCFLSKILYLFPEFHKSSPTTVTSFVLAGKKAGVTIQRYSVEVRRMSEVMTEAVVSIEIRLLVLSQ